MKNIFVAVIFLFSQIGMTAQKAKLINSSGFHIENGTFSSLVLSSEEISHLSDKDKTEYLFSMIALAQILESAQSDKMGYDESGISKKTTFNDSKIIQLLEASISKSQALLFLGPMASFALEAVGSMAAWEALKAGFKFVAKKAAARALAAGEKKAAESAGKVAASNILTKGSKEALQAGETLVKNAASRMKAADAAVKGNKDPKKKAVLLKEAMEAEHDLGLAKNAFVNGYGGDPKKLGKLINGSLFERYITNANIAKLTVAGLAFEGALGIYKGAEGGDPSDIAEGSAAAALTAAELKAGDSKQEKGKSCLFGGHPSKWKDFGPVEKIKCTRPPESRAAGCDGANEFQCPDYGVTLVEGSIQSALCMKEIGSLNDLTVRCSKMLLDIVSKKKAVVEKEKNEKYFKEFAEVAKRIEVTPTMTNEDGKPKSIFQYCAADSSVQKAECGAITEVLAALKQTGVPKVLAARPAAAPVGAPPAAAEAATAADAAAKK